MLSSVAYKCGEKADSVKINATIVKNWHLLCFIILIAFCSRLIVSANYSKDYSIKGDIRGEKESLEEISNEEVHLTPVILLAIIVITISLVLIFD